MSSVGPKPNSRAITGAAIINELRAAALPASPRDFEFWFAHKSGRNPALNAAADAITATRALTADDIAQLYEQHLSPWRAAGGGADTIATRLSDELHALAVQLDAAIGAARSQRQTMINESTELSITSALTLQHVFTAIDRLMQSTKDGQARYAQIEARMTAASREIAALKQQLAAVRAECRADPLTTLPGRSAFDAELATALEHAAATRQPVTVMIADLDYFGAFNDTFGADAADRVLRIVGMLFKSIVRPGDTVSRFADDALGAIMPQATAREAIEYAERFRRVLMTNDLVKHDNGLGRVTVSIGLAGAIKGDTPEFLLRRAGNGLKVAKKEGRNRVVEMTPDGPTWDAERRV